MFSYKNLSPPENAQHITSKESVYIRKEFNFHGTGLGHQYGGLDVISKGFMVMFTEPTF